MYPVYSIIKSKKDLVSWHFGEYLLTHFTDEETMVEYFGVGIVGNRVYIKYTYKMSGFLFLKSICYWAILLYAC